MKFIDDNFDRVSPYPFICWLSVGLIFIALSPAGISMNFIEANSTYINITYGMFISTAIMLICCMMLYFNGLRDKPLKLLYALSRVFSDTAMGAAGFIAALSIYNNNYGAAAALSFGVLLYTLTGNHIYHSVFNENKGSRRLIRKIDEISNTKIGRGLIERDIERKALGIASIIILAVSSWLAVTLYFVSH